MKLFPRLIIVLLIGLIGLSVVSAQEITPPPPSDSTGFSVALYDQLRLEEGNLFFSPYSISNAFLMTYVGAEGNTAQQMRDVLMITADDASLNQTFADYNVFITARNNMPEDEYNPERVLTVSNGLWSQQDFALLPDYPATLAQFFSATITPMDFIGAPEESRQIINDAVAEQTRDRIQDLLPDGVIDAMTRLILTNAVYFKANWQNSFNVIESAPFTLADDTLVDVPSMRVRQNMAYLNEEGVVAVAVPYNGYSSHMVIVMPDDMADYEANLAQTGLPDMLTSPTYPEVNLTMPKFEFESRFGLSDTLSTMGMTDAFNPDLADFSGISTESQLFIQEALHQAYIGVDENGTEAAAATAVIIGVTSAPMPTEPIDVTIDKPFLFYIQDTVTGEILFMGRVMNPSE
jgi:serpin B